MKLALFAYNFPHKKTQDFLLRLFLEGYHPEFVVACDPVRLNVPEPILRAKPVHIDIIHPRLICQRLDIPYYVLPHNSQRVAELIQSNNIDIGVIAGARILKKTVIESAGKGIINFHPGLIPEVRGLDALKWAIYHELPIGVTAHFVDERVDAGRIIIREEIPIRSDDTLIDISLRLAETETNLLPKVLSLVKDRPVTDFPLVPHAGKANPPMSDELEREIPRKLAERLSKIHDASNPQSERNKK